MRITLSATQETSDDVIGALLHWLNRDPDVRRVAKVTPGTSAGDGSMGAFDTISVLLTHAEAIAAVLLAYDAWRMSRRKAPGLTVSGDTGSVTITDASPETIAKVLVILSSQAAGSGVADAAPAAGTGRLDGAA
ncbi:effector-associated constant component EACC1 [Micromonospora sp. NPDC004704]